ncbi:hypothetical protein JNK13_03490 [bacterium]|nr:hypothetical protein [bacterium]
MNQRFESACNELKSIKLPVHLKHALIQNSRLGVSQERKQGYFTTRKLLQPAFALTVLVLGLALLINPNSQISQNQNTPAEDLVSYLSDDVTGLFDDNEAFDESLLLLEDVI